MNNFRVGDIVTGRAHNGYNITTEHAKMKVLYLHGEESMEVLVLSHVKYPECVGGAYQVHSEHFKLLKPKSFTNK